MKLPSFVTRQLGFTMVELLVVISIIGILATAVLAALNPVEQLKKARDTARKADAQTVLGAIDRFQATFGCYPWQLTGTTCSTTTVTGPLELAGSGAAIAASSFATGGSLEQLGLKDELKSQFQERTSVTASELWLSVNGVGQASVCFEPESKSSRGGGLGPIKGPTNETITTTDCTTGAYSRIDATSTCAVCVPQ